MGFFFFFKETGMSAYESNNCHVPYPLSPLWENDGLPAPESVWPPLQASYNLCTDGNISGIPNIL